MLVPTGDPDVLHNPTARWYEIHVGPDIAGIAVYAPTADGVAFSHTEIEAPFEGQGLGSRLVKAALDDVRAKDLSVTPLCPFVDRYIRNHPEYVPMVAASHRDRFQP